jgi:hypothetical protein
VIHGRLSGDRARIVVRVDDEATAIRVRWRSSTRDLTLDPPAPGKWRSARATLEGVATGEPIELEAVHAFRDYHVWIDEPAGPEAPANKASPAR